MNQTGFKVKGIFLDLDGTIVDSTEAYIEAATRAFHTIGLQPPEKKTALEIPRRLEQGFPLTEFTNGETKKFLSVYFKTYYAVSYQKTKLIPNVSTALDALSQKAKLALITMRYAPKQTIIEELECFGISQYFTHVVTALDTAKPKPSPEALIACVKALDIEICDCVMAGDSVSDIRAGKAAGAKTIALLSGLYRCEELLKECPDLILNDLTALPQFID
jgi:HAD superfamily hydrolase (TIGR01509 family)